METNSNHESQHLDCKEFLNKVVASLDGALTADEESDLLEEVKYHACCLDQINIARCYKVFLAQKVKRHQVDASLIESIKAQIERETTHELG